MPSARPEFAGFDAVYRTEIEPYLRENEGRRRRAIFAFAAAVAATAFVAVILAMQNSTGFPGLEAALLALMGGSAGALWILNRARSVIADGLLGRAAAGLGLSYRSRIARHAYSDTLCRLRLFGAFNRESWEDEVSGTYAGVSFRLCEAHLEHVSGSGKNRRVRTIFHGQVFDIGHPSTFLGETILRRDAGLLNAMFMPGKGFSRVGLASPAFERAFEAWSTDQVEARTLLDPVVLERFLELERLHRGRKLRAAFVDGRLFIAVETGDRLGMGTMFEPLADPRRVENILRDFDAIFDLIDVAVKPVDGRLDGAFSLAAVKAGAT